MTPSEIRNLRKRLGWTQVQLGEYLGYGTPGQRVSELERGTRGLTPAVKKLLEQLKASLDEK